MESLEVRRLSNMTEVVCLLREGGGCWVSQGLGRLRCGEEMGGGRKGSLVLMSRRRSSGPPWSAPRPPDPGHPWS